MTAKEAALFLEKINQYGSVPGLDSVTELCRRVGNPQDTLQFVHIAGTNGKGSVLKLVSDACKESGIRTGRYLSPTLIDYRERFQINGRMISKQKLYAYLERMQHVCDEMVADGLKHPTAFEMETALAFLYFKEENCDLVILETGMGGTLDATNLIQTTKVSVITSISIDHTAFLGKTIHEIAANKAGILKKGARVVCYPSCEEALQVIMDKAAECNIPTEHIIVSDPSLLRDVRYKLGKQSFSYKKYSKMQLGLSGKYQIMNAAVALDVLKVLGEVGYPVKEQAVRKVFREAVWPGRMEVLSRNPLFIIDGAHNADAAERLAESIELYFTNKKIIYIMGVLRDKDYTHMINVTHRYADQIITVKTPDNPRAMEAYDLAREVSLVHNKVTVADSLMEAVEMAYLLSDKNSVILAFGSLSYLGELRKIVAERAKRKSEIKI